MPLTRTHTEKQCFIAWAHSLRTPSFPLFLGRPVCQLLYRRDVEILHGNVWEMFCKCILSKRNLFKFLHVIRSIASAEN